MSFVFSAGLLNFHFTSHMKVAAAVSSRPIYERLNKLLPLAQLHSTFLIFLAPSSISKSHKDRNKAEVVFGGSDEHQVPSVNHTNDEVKRQG